MAQDMSAPITLASDEAASTDIDQGGFDGVRGEVINQMASFLHIYSASDVFVTGVAKLRML